MFARRFTIPLTWLRVIFTFILNYNIKAIFIVLLYKFLFTGGGGWFCGLPKEVYSVFAGSLCRVHINTKVQTVIYCIGHLNWRRYRILNDSDIEF